MTSRANIYYFGVIICIYLWENILFGNLTAYYERNICTVQINKKGSLEKLNIWLDQHD